MVGGGDVRRRKCKVEAKQGRDEAEGRNGGEARRSRRQGKAEVKQRKDKAEARHRRGIGKAEGMQDGGEERWRKIVVEVRSGEAEATRRQSGA